MEQIKLGPISRQELSEATKVLLGDSHFARAVKTKLTNWGYKYDYPKNGRNITITYQPTTAPERLKELMLRRFNLDIQIIQSNGYTFAAFVYLLAMDEEFAMMPDKTRSERLYEFCGQTVDPRTIHNWAEKLIERKFASIDSQNWRYWKTVNDNGVKRQVPSDDEEERRKYLERKKELETIAKEKKGVASLSRKDWNNIKTTLWHEFGCCYYSCKQLMFEIFEEDALLIFSLIDEVLAKGYDL